MTIRSARTADITKLAEICNYYVGKTIVTFEEEAVGNSVFEERIDKIVKASYPWPVAEDGGGVAGYAYASRWNDRSDY